MGPRPVCGQGISRLCKETTSGSMLSFTRPIEVNTPPWIDATYLKIRQSGRLTATLLDSSRC